MISHIVASHVIIFHQWNLLWTHQTYRYPIHLRKKIGNGPTVLENSACFVNFSLFRQRRFRKRGCHRIENKGYTEQFKEGKSPSPSSSTSKNTSLLHHNTNSLALIFTKNYKDVLRVFTPGWHIWNRKLLWVGGFSQHSVFLTLELRRCRYRHFFKFNALFSAVTAVYRFSNFTLSNRFLCSLFFGQQLE